MDVHCSSCGEPWDTFHLWQDAIYETDLDETEAEAWRHLPRDQRLSPHYREHLKTAGWDFGQSILDVRHCPCCPEGATPDQNKVAIKSAIVELLGDDEDGIASTFEDYGL